MSLNKVMLIGNLGAEPEMRFTANGTAMTSFRMAVTRVSTQDGERREETEWVSVVTWAKLAENVNQHLAKGSKVYVEGRLQTRSWEGPDGKKNYRTEVIAQDVQFLDRKGAEPAAEPNDAEDLPF